jgi:cytoskeletal protein CcmA (bactofilin family)
MNGAEGAAVIGKSVKIIGQVSGSEDLMVDGELQGTIHLPGARLTIGPAAWVRADVIAQDVVVFGRMEGVIRAKGRCELRASALVQGEIFAATLSIEENASFRGKIDPTRAGEGLPTAAVSGGAEKPEALGGAAGGGKAAGSSASLFAEDEG